MRIKRYDTNIYQFDCPDKTCRKKFTAREHLIQHCKKRPVNTACHQWYLQIYCVEGWQEEDARGIRGSISQELWIHLSPDGSPNGDQDDDDPQPRGDDDDAKDQVLDSPGSPVPEGGFYGDNDIDMQDNFEVQEPYLIESNHDEPRRQPNFWDEFVGQPDFDAEAEAEAEEEQLIDDLNEAFDDLGLPPPQIDQLDIADPSQGERLPPQAETDQSPPISLSSRIHRTEYFPGASKVFGRGKTMLECFQEDALTQDRVDNNNLYEPFRSKSEWEFTHALMSMDCSLQEKTRLLRTNYIQDRGDLSYNTALAARDLIDQLPSFADAPWEATEVSIPGFQTKKPARLYLRDTLKLLQHLLRNPMFADSFNPIPRRHYDIDGKRIITDAMSANWAWEAQKKLPPGHTLISLGFASDKALLAIGHGDSEVYPFLIFTNAIGTDIRTKISTHSTLAAGFLPIPKFLVDDDKLQRTLFHRLIHKCLRLITAPLREVSLTGVPLSDMWGNLRICHPVISNLMVDHPELLLYLGITGAVSAVTTATSYEWGDSERHETRWGSATFQATKDIAAQYNLNDPDEFLQYVYACYAENLTGVEISVFDDWAHVEPVEAAVFDTLHFGHKFFYDHPVKWMIAAVGEKEINFRFSVLPRRAGWHHFSGGITGLGKTSGPDHRNIHRWILAVIAGAVPPQVAKMMRAYITYSNRCQRREIGEDDITAINEGIRVFHEHKSILLTNGYRTSRRRYKWAIPKLEIQHHIVRSMLYHGELRGLSTDISEGLLPSTVKRKYRRTNGREYLTQIIQGLNRDEQLSYFDLLTALTEAEVDLQPEDTPDLTAPLPHMVWIDTLPSIKNLRGQQRSSGVNYFAVSEALALARAQNSVPSKNINRMRTRALTEYTAIHLKRDADITCMSIEDAAIRFNLPDLSFCIAEYYYLVANPDLLCRTKAMQKLPAQHRNAITELSTALPFSSLKIWFSIRIQNKSLIHQGRVNPSQNLYATPPPEQTTRRTATKYTLGRYDTCLFINDLTKEFTGKSNLTEHTVGQIRLVFQPVNRQEQSTQPWLICTHLFDKDSTVNHVGLQRLK